MSRFNQKGLAPLILIVLALVGLVIGVWLVQNRTNFLPNAQFADPNLSKETAFHLFLDKNYYLTNDPGNVSISQDSGGEGSSDSMPTDGNSSGGSGRIMPTRTWFYPGEEIRVNLAVSSDIDSANTFSAIINFPPDLLEVTSIQKESKDSWPVPLPYPVEAGVMSNSDTVASTGNSTSGEGRICAAVITRACTLDQVQCVTAPCPPQEVCKDFSSPCEVPPGWYLEKDKCRSDADCKGPGQFCDYLSHPPRTDTMVCKNKVYTCWSQCTDQQAKLNIGDKCNQEEFPYQHITQGDVVMAMRGCAANEQGETKICNQNGVIEKYDVFVQGRGITNITPFCSPTPPLPSCKPIPSCAYSNPACDIYIDPNDPSWCHNTPSTQDYFIRFWLPDTGFDNNAGKITLSGGVSGGGILTVPPSKPVMATVTFKAKKAGEAIIYVADESVILRNADSANILTNKNKLMVQVQEKPTPPVIKGDLNGDGIVGFVDFSILLTNWGTDSKKADITGDGKVDIFDFSVMLTNWSGRRGLKPIQKCPEEWIQNMMPGVADENSSGSSYPSEYFIYEGKRREMSEFDMDWVKMNCNIKPQPVY